MYNVLLFLNFYFGETIKAEPALFYDFIKIVSGAILASGFTYIGFGIRDYLDYEKRLRKMNVKLINLFEDLKEVNNKIPKLIISFNDYGHFKNQEPLLSYYIKNRYFIIPLERILSIDKDLIFERLLIYSDNSNESMLLFRNLFNDLRNLEIFIDKGYERIFETEKLFTIETEKLSNLITDIVKLVYDEITKDIEDGNIKSNNILLKIFNSYKKSDKTFNSALNIFIIPLNDSYVNEYNTSLSHKLEPLIFKSFGAVSEMKRFSKYLSEMSIETSEYLSKVYIDSKNNESQIIEVINNQKVNIYSKASLNGLWSYSFKSNS